MIIQDKKFLIYGVGKTGVSLSKFISKNGGKIAVYNNKNSEIPKEIENIGVENRCGLKKRELFDGIYAMILSPGVSIYDDVVKYAISQKVTVLSEMDFSFEYLSGIKVGITASGGKSTTTKLVCEMLKEQFTDVRIGGNYGIPICEMCENSTPQTISVIEVSSFMLEQSRKFHFDVAVFSNISKNHLDRHKTMSKYLFSKCKIAKNSTSHDVVIIPQGSEKIKAGILKNFKKNGSGKILYFQKVSCEKNFKANDKTVKNENRIEDSWVYVQNHQVVRCEDFNVPGVHNQENLLVATMVAKWLGVGDKGVAMACKKFQPLAHRFEKISANSDEQYINDSKATSAKSAETSLEMINFPAVLMVGGSDKNDSFYDLFEKIKGNSCIVKVVIYGKVSQKIQSHAKAVGYHNFEKCKDFVSAFNAAKSICVAGTTLVLLPACPSYDEFDNFEKRGEKFKKLIEEQSYEK